MGKPAIIVCATAYRPFIGGAEIAIEEATKRLSGSFDFFILTARLSRDVPRRESGPDGTIIRLGFGYAWDKWLLPVLIPLFLRRAFRRARQKMPPPLLWGVDISQGALGAWATAILRPRTPFIFTLQYGESEHYLARGRMGLVGFAFRRMLGRADFVTAISAYLLDVSRRYGFCGPAEIIHNGVDVKKFKSRNPEIKHTNQNTKTIITVSRLVPKNRIDLLIRAFGRLKETAASRSGPETSPIRLQIIGDGPEKESLKKLAVDIGVGGDTRFLGAISNEEIPRYLAESDIFVRPSDSEGMGIAFVEALAAGVPAIGTAVGGIRDVIEDGKTGLLAERGDENDIAEKMARLIDDEPFRQSMIAAGEEKVKREFDWDAIALSYRRIFQQAFDTKKRIVIATPLYPPEIGGPATYTKILADELPRLGIGVSVVAFRSVHRLPKIVRHGAYFLRVCAASRGRDVVYAQDPVSTGLAALLAARLMRKKFVLKIVGDYAWEQYMHQESRIRNQPSETLEEFQEKKHDTITEIRRCIQKFVARRAERSIVPSQYLKGIVTAWGVPEENITVVYNAFDPPERQISKEEARHALGISADALQIVSVGRLVPWKGFAELIDAMAAVRKEAPEARLSIIGSGPQEQALRLRIATHGLEGAVSLVGGVPRADVLRRLRASDLFILNSSYEGFSHTLLEALAVGTSVMASDVGGNGEIIKDGVNGRLYQDRDAEYLAREILHLYSHPEMRSRFAAEGEAMPDRFSKERMLVSTLNLLLK